MENQNVAATAGRIAEDGFQTGDERSIGVIGFEGTIERLHRIAAPAHLHHGRIVEVLGERLHVDRRAGDDHLEIATAGQQTLQIAEDEINVQAAFVGFVDDDALVAAQTSVALDFVQQQPIRHHLHDGVGGGLVRKAHGIADFSAQLHAKFLGDACRDGTRRHPPGLRVGDGAEAADAGGKAGFRELRGLARAGLAGDHQHLMAAQQIDDLVDARGDGKLRGKVGDG